MPQFGVESQLLAHCPHHLGQLQYRELFCELVEDTKFTRFGRIQTCDFDTAYSVSNIQKSPRLPALSVHGQYMSQGSLRAKPVQDSSKYLIIVEAIDESLVQRCLFRHRPVYNTLVEICRTDSPYLASEGDVVAVMH